MKDRGMRRPWWIVLVGPSVAVGSVKGLHAAVSSVATSLDGRIWVTWAGEVNGHGITAFTRSNKAVTRFEPIQTCSPSRATGAWDRSTS